MEDSKTTYIKKGTAVFGVVGASAVKQLAQETLNLQDNPDEVKKTTTVTSKFHINTPSVPRQIVIPQQHTLDHEGVEGMKIGQMIPPSTSNNRSLGQA